MTERRGVIYALSDPRYGDVVRYVGATTMPLRRRVGQHMRGQTWTTRRWVEDLLAAGGSPGVILADDDVPAGRLDRAEAEAIRRHHEGGAVLLNKNLMGGLRTPLFLPELVRRCGSLGIPERWYAQGDVQQYRIRSLVHSRRVASDDGDREDLLAESDAVMESFRLSKGGVVPFTLTPIDHDIERDRRDFPDWAYVFPGRLRP